MDQNFNRWNKVQDKPREDIKTKQSSLGSFIKHLVSFQQIHSQISDNSKLKEDHNVEYGKTKPRFSGNKD